MDQLASENLYSFTMLLAYCPMPQGDRLLKKCFCRPKMALATKNQIPVANWLPKIGIGDQKQISSSQLANKIFSQRRALMSYPSLSRVIIIEKK